ncbi:MAG: NAD-dependent epimerase/dehydratase family protein [Proteobacteria bacterium]|nr:NAD-dependent epimerase/dehydratase family protein [Pseudomonadota bacterium]MBU1714736.1 NAD-dependent epimerase/dehydratase family protein [Pseudomonadota bacterium]
MTGGTGLIGRHLCRHLIAMGHEVTVLSRSVQNKKQKWPESVSFWEGDPAQKGPWQNAISEYEVIINLAGAPAKMVQFQVP